MPRLPSLAVLLVAAGPGVALEPKDVFVVVNTAVPASRAVADHYLARRNVPKENVVELALPAGEEMTREEYDARLAGPLREALKARKDGVKCLLTVYGVPVRVGPKLPTDAEKAELEQVTKAIDAAKKMVTLVDSGQVGRGAESDNARALLPRLEERRLRLSHDQSTAAVDSELALLWWPPYNVTRYVVNPANWQFPADKRRGAPPVLLTARLDGPTPDIAKRLVDDAVEAERAGLAGKVYVDARGLKYDPNHSSENAGGYGYGGYDESMRETAALFRKAGLDVTRDDKDTLFPPNSCPDCAVYCGWYSLANFVDSATFVKGAVGWHLASSEAVSVRDATKKYWVPNLLQKGVAVTLGPVAEPYTIGFPKPAEFFGLLATGKYTVAEVHLKTQTFLSWMTVLIGDPLYNPFGKKPLLKEEDVAFSPKGGKPLFK